MTQRHAIKTGGDLLNSGLDLFANLKIIEIGVWPCNSYPVMRFFSRTPVRTFLLYPLVTLIWELVIHAGRIEINLWYLPLMIWGFLQYRWCGKYRMARGGGGPGPEIPPERLVSTGPYAHTRNPMYLGHIIFLTGLTLTLRSWLAGLITIAVAVWFHFRVLADERNLSVKLGSSYVSYTKSVKRWVPGLF